MMKSNRSAVIGSRSYWVGLLMLVMLTFPVQANDVRSVLPDLTDLPAQMLRDADQSVQLAVTNAGDRLVSVGEQGIVLLSDDQGASWRQSAGVPVSVTLTAVEFVSDTDGWAVGHSGVVLKTTDAGERWQRIMTGSQLLEVIQTATNKLPEGFSGVERIQRNAAFLNGTEPILDVYFNSEGKGWLVGAYGIALYTTDSGETWRSGFATIENPNSSHLYQLVTADTGLALVVGERGYAAAYSAESGNFSPFAIGYDGTFFGGLSLDSENYLLYGLRGNIWKGSSTDWQRIPSGTQASFTAAISLPSGVMLGDVAGRLFLFSRQSNSIRELVVTADAAITDFTLNSRGELIMTTARGLKLLGLNNLEFK